MIIFIYDQRAGPPESCEGLFLAGHTLPGYYFVDGTGGENYQAVFCNFGLDPSDAEFQVDTEVKFAEYPVAFDFYRKIDYSTTGTVIPYEYQNINDGDGMAMDGVFTVPIDGTYIFTFMSTVGRNNGQNLLVYVRVDSTTKATAFGRDGVGEVDDWIGVSATLIVSLKQGQKVDAFLKSGEAHSSSGTWTKFSGYLVSSS